MYFLSFNEIAKFLRLFINFAFKNLTLCLMTGEKKHLSKLLIFENLFFPCEIAIKFYKKMTIDHL